VKIAVVGNRNFVLFFELAGAEGFIVENEEEILSKLKELVESEEYGMIIIPERLVDATKKLRESMMHEGRAYPILAFVPDLTVPLPRRRLRDLQHLLVMAIGTEVRL